MTLALRHLVRRIRARAPLDARYDIDPRNPHVDVTRRDVELAEMRTHRDEAMRGRKGAR